jgi:isochorismate pyruvate lyase
MDNRICSPEACTSMAEVRAGVDALDADLARLLGQRFAYMRAAARIKPERHLVRDEARKAQVIANAQRAAREANWPEDIAAQLWEVLVEASIAYELAAFDARADQPA